MSRVTLKSAEKHSVNPFMGAFNVDVGIKKKIIAGKDAEAVLNKKGEIIGQAGVFVSHQKVDKTKFIKVFQEGLGALHGLSKASLKVFEYIAVSLKPNSDEVMFISKDCMAYTGYRSKKSIENALAQLVDKGFIARSEFHFKYFINPKMFFNGDRLVFIKSYQMDDTIKVNGRDLDKEQYHF